MAVDKQYLEEAKQMLSGGMEAQKVQLQNSLAQNVQGLEGQKAGVNQNFDKQLEQNAINTTNAQNQYLNNSLARGLGRSTIATSGAAGIKDSGNRIANNVNTDRTNALDNIEAQKVKLSEALQASLLGLSANFESQQLTLAQQLADSAYNRQWQEGQFSYQKEQDAIANALAQAKFDFSKQQALSSGSGGGGGSYGGSGSSGSGDNANIKLDATWNKFDTLLGQYINDTSKQSALSSYIDSLAKSDPETYKIMNQMYQETRQGKITAAGAQRKPVSTAKTGTTGGVTYLKGTRTTR